MGLLKDLMRIIIPFIIVLSYMITVSIINFHSYRVSMEDLCYPNEYIQYNMDSYCLSQQDVMIRQHYLCDVDFMGFTECRRVTIVPEEE